MDMVMAHNTPQNLYLEPFTNLADKFPDMKCQSALQHVVAIFCGPHKMVLCFIFGMTSLSIIHFSILIQLNGRINAGGIKHPVTGLSGGDQPKQKE